MNDQATESATTDELRDGELHDDKLRGGELHEDEFPADEELPEAVVPDGADSNQADSNESDANESDANESDSNESGDQADAGDQHVEDEDPEGADPEEESPVEEPPEEELAPTYQRFDCTDASDESALIEAATAARHAIESGTCVVLPTDTVYGIGADAYDAEAVQRLLDAKGRGRDMPPPVLIADAKVLKALAEDVPEAVEKLVEKFWPGPLTIICTAKSSLRMDLGETRGTVAVRVPDHELTRTLLRQTGPMAVSSANRSGHPTALTCQDAVDQLGNAVAVYLDGGAVGGPTGKPSTMIDFTIKDTGQVLRRGALTLAELSEYLPELEDLTSDEPEHPDYTAAELRARHTLQPPAADVEAG